MQAAVAAAIIQVFQAPIGEASPEDRLQLHRLEDLAAQLRAMLPGVIQVAAARKLPLLKNAQQIIEGDMWLNEPAKVCSMLPSWQWQVVACMSIHAGVERCRLTINFGAGPSLLTIKFVFGSSLMHVCMVLICQASCCSASRMQECLT